MLSFTKINVKIPPEVLAGCFASLTNNHKHSKERAVVSKKHAILIPFEIVHCNGRAVLKSRCTWLQTIHGILCNSR